MTPLFRTIFPVTSAKRRSYKPFLIALALCFLQTGCADLKTASADYRAGNHDRAAKQWQELAEFGEPRAQVSLGRAHLNGEGVAKDPQKAKVLFEQAASQNEPSGFFELGRLHEKGIAVDRDLAKAATLYKQSADMGYSRGFYYLAKLQERHGLAPQSEIRHYYQCALDGGYDRAVDDIERLLQP